VTLDEFNNLLRNAYGYRSPPARAGLPARLPGGATLCFNLRLLGLVYRSQRLARQGRYDARAWAEASVWTVGSVEAVGGRVEISGLESRAGHSGPVVYAANHMSLLDTFVLPCVAMAFGDVTFVVKESLLRYPWFGRVVRAGQPIAVTRTDPRRDLQTLMERGAEAVDAGRSVVVFPQATRTAWFAPDRFGSAAARLAARLDVPLVPAALKTDFLTNGRWVKDLGRVHPERVLSLQFGELLAPSGRGRENHELATAFIAETLRGWGVEIAASATAGGGGKD
jgi:1-acyl-sn-glycerol-3-phosphate acyltransferase